MQNWLAINWAKRTLYCYYDNNRYLCDRIRRRGIRVRDDNPFKVT